MDYSRIYIELMERSFERDLDGYTEKHHIVPKCMGGDDKPRNIAVLTPEEHYLAHQLLVKIYPKNRKLVYAANLMGGTGMRRCNKSYGWIRRKMGALQTGKTLSQDHKHKISIGLMGRTPTDDTKKKLSKSKEGSKNPFWSKKHSSVVMIKLLNSPKSKSVLKISNDGVIIDRYSSLREAARINGLSHANISKCCRGELKMSGGYVWKFEEYKL